ncbi:MAG: TIGR04283 family arsenosugar biosynthesis glycosyltransferase [Balneola sp.]
MISIIVPVFNEEVALREFIPHIDSCISGKDAELIFVDGGSTDNTVSLCSQSGANVYTSPQQGRSSQMNYGASKAKGSVLYFVHVDSLPPISFLDDIIENVSRGYSSGCYRLSFNQDHYMLRFYTWFTRFDINLFRFGDQSLFVEKEKFDEINGFDESLKVMEDQQIVRELKKVGEFVVMKKKIVTSSRKYMEVGIIKLQLIFTAVVCLFYFGVSQKVIANFYRNRLK